MNKSISEVAMTIDYCVNSITTQTRGVAFTPERESGWLTLLDAHTEGRRGRVPAAGAPFRLAEQPVGQGDDLGGTVPAVVLVGVLDRVARDPPLAVEREDEQAGEPLFLGQLEDRGVPAKEGA